MLAFWNHANMHKNTQKEILRSAEMESLRSANYGSNNYNYRKSIDEEEDGEFLINSNDFRREKAPISDHATANKAVAASKRQPMPPSTTMEEDINKSAEAFIRKFRQQLVIQRLESIENYEKMLARGT